MNKCPSSIWGLDSKPRCPRYESPPITIELGKYHHTFGVNVIIKFKHNLRLSNVDLNDHKKVLGVPGDNVFRKNSVLSEIF